MSDIENQYLTNQITRLSKPKLPPNELYIFFHFDLVDSTRLKNELVQNNEWVIVIKKFYSAMQHEIETEYPNIKRWKLLGDAISFYLHANAFDSIDDICSIFQKSFQAQKRTCNLVTYENNFKKQVQIHIKTTLFCADTKFLDYENITYENINSSKDVSQHFYNLGFIDEENPIDLPGNGNKSTIRVDFLGPDIDIGFRLASKANKRSVTVSAELAFIISSLGMKNIANPISKSLRIVNYEKLKGVWNDRAYPIIWYHPDWNNIKENFDYDEHVDNESIKNIFLNAEQEVNEKLSNIMEKQFLLEKLNEIIKKMRTDFKSKTKIVDITYMKETLAPSEETIKNPANESRIMSHEKFLSLIAEFDTKTKKKN